MTISRNAWMLVGILLWGIPTGIITSLMMAIYQSRSLSGGYLFSYDDFLRNVSLTMPVFCIMGLAIGLVMFNVGKNAKRKSPQAENLR